MDIRVLNHLVIEYQSVISFASQGYLSKENCGYEPVSKLGLIMGVTVLGILAGQEHKPIKDGDT